MILERMGIFYIQILSKSDFNAENALSTFYGISTNKVITPIFYFQKVKSSTKALPFKKPLYINALCMRRNNIITLVHQAR